MNYKCFECGTSECIQHHHIIPESLGGTKTIPLCSMCHARAHGIKRNKQIDISRLTKEGLAAAKKRGVKLGTAAKPMTEEGYEKSMKTRVLGADEYALKMKPIILPMLSAGMSYNTIAKKLNENNISTPRKGSWYAASVINLLKRLEISEDK